MNNQRKDLSSDQKNELTDYFTKIISALGDNPNRQELQKTPQRALESLRYLTRGYEVDINDLMKDAFFTSEMDEMVIVKNIELYSLCEHHLLPFIGKCHLAYLPAGRVIGLSKMADIVDMYACRLQIQETLTKQIADCLQTVTQAKGVGVIIEAQHLCMMMRGSEKQNSWVKTSSMNGLFRSDPRTRSEFLKLVMG